MVKKFQFLMHLHLNHFLSILFKIDLFDNMILKSVIVHLKIYNSVKGNYMYLVCNVI